jgi:hypothetical protein
MERLDLGGEAVCVDFPDRREEMFEALARIPWFF